MDVIRSRGFCGAVSVQTADTVARLTRQARPGWIGAIGLSSGAIPEVSSKMANFQAALPGRRTLGSHAAVGHFGTAQPTCSPSRRASAQATAPPEKPSARLSPAGPQGVDRARTPRVRARLFRAVRAAAAAQRMQTESQPGPSQLCPGQRARAQRALPRSRISLARQKRRAPIAVEPVYPSSCRSPSPPSTDISTIAIIRGTGSTLTNSARSADPSPVRHLETQVDSLSPPTGSHSSVSTHAHPASGIQHPASSFQHRSSCLRSDLQALDARASAHRDTRRPLFRCYIAA